MQKLELRSDKAPGLDELFSQFLKGVAVDISAPLSAIMKRSLATGHVPHEWKQANVCPIFKKGNKGWASNYRPVSLTSQICKIFERIMCEQI